MLTQRQFSHRVIISNEANWLGISNLIDDIDATASLLEAKSTACENPTQDVAKVLPSVTQGVAKRYPRCCQALPKVLPSVTQDVAKSKRLVCLG